ASVKDSADDLSAVHCLIAETVQWSAFLHLRKVACRVMDVIDTRLLQRPLNDYRGSRGIRHGQADLHICRRCTAIRSVEDWLARGESVGPYADQRAVVGIGVRCSSVVIIDERHE